MARADMLIIRSPPARLVLHFDGARFRVAPDSAAPSRPKCYRRCGPLALTAANVRVGQLIPDFFFPKIFGRARTRRSSRGGEKIHSPSSQKKSAAVAGGNPPTASSDRRRNRANARSRNLVQRVYRRHPLRAETASAAPAAITPASSPTRSGMNEVLIPLLVALSAYGMGAPTSAHPPAVIERHSASSPSPRSARGRPSRQGRQYQFACQGVPRPDQGYRPGARPLRLHRTRRCGRAGTLAK